MNAPEMTQRLSGIKGAKGVHLDWEKGYYIKAIMDEVFGEHNFVYEITWKGADAHNDSTRLGIVDNRIFCYAIQAIPLFRPWLIKSPIATCKLVGPVGLNSKL